jgi:predicted Zn finger-like uncharacterized protein
MIVGCVGCGTKFVVPDEKVPETGIKVRCSKCQQTFYIKKEKTKKGGPSSVILVDPELIAEVQRMSRPDEPEPPQDAPTQDASTQQAAPQDASSQDAHSQDTPSQDTPSQDSQTQEGAPPEMTRPDAVPPQVSSRAQPPPAARPDPTPTVTLRRSSPTLITRGEDTKKTQAPRASGARGRASVQVPEEEPVFELEEVYLPPDWGKRIALAVVGLLGLSVALFVAVIIRNGFSVPPLKDAFSVLLFGPAKRAGGGPPKTIDRSRSFEERLTGVDALTSDAGVRIVAVQGEVKNISSEPHGRYYVRAVLTGVNEGERLESERPCGTQLEPPELTTLTGPADLDALYTEGGEGGANERVLGFNSVRCTVVFFGAPDWAERSDTKKTLTVTKFDGAPVGP